MTLLVVNGSALVILNNGNKILIKANSIPPPPINLTLTRDLRYIGLSQQCSGVYMWININGSLFKSDSSVSMTGNSTFKVIEVLYAPSMERPVNATLVYLGPLSASTLSNATYIIDVLNVTSCGGAVTLTPALIVVGLSNGTLVSLAWSYWVVVA